MANNHRCLAINSRNFAMVNEVICKTLKARLTGVNQWDALL